MNPNGKVPLAKLPDRRCLAESNAILSYLADGSDLAGKSRYGKASVLQWMFFEQYSHEPYIATSRFIIQYLGNPAERRADLESKRTGGHKALTVMDEHLNGREFFANDAYSIADIALYAYTHVAHEGGFDLGRYSNIRAWLMRVQQQENYVPMRARP
jgi:glutathione S-transferase